MGAIIALSPHQRARRAEAVLSMLEAIEAAFQRATAALERGDSATARACADQLALQSPPEQAGALTPLLTWIAHAAALAIDDDIASRKPCPFCAPPANDAPTFDNIHDPA